MRKYYLDNIRWATVLAVVFYHILFMYNHTLTAGVAGAVTDFAGQDALQYLLYPWFMVVLFLCVPSLSGSVGVLVPVGALLAIGVARILYKKGKL